MKRIQINISTRLLAYFLFVTILPLFILTVTSTMLLQSSLNDKLNQELEIKKENIWKSYLSSFENFKTSISSIPIAQLQKNLLLYQNKKINQELENIAARSDYQIVLLLDHNKKILSAYTDKNLLSHLKTINHSSLNLNNIIDFRSNKQIQATNELISLKDLLDLGIIKNKNLENSYNTRLGFISQIGITGFNLSNKKYHLAVFRIIDNNSSFIKSSKFQNVAVIINQDNNVISSNLQENTETVPIYLNINQTENQDQNQLIIRNIKYKSAFIPIKNLSGNEIGGLITGLSEEYINNLKFESSALMTEIALLIAIAGIILAYLLAKTITTPLLSMSKVAGAIEKGNFSERVDINSSDEIGYLAKSFNNMAAALQKRQELEEIKDDLVSTLTHDLKVPVLASVQTLEYFLKGSYGELNEKQIYITEQLIINNKDLLRMVNTILDSHKYDAGKQTLVKRKTNINKLITECITELSSLIEEKKHNVHFNPYYEEGEITADKQELKRVIINLIGNAITYTPENGFINITTKLENTQLIFSIEDNGIGISEDSVKSLFQRFSREKRTLRKIGTGLGLYLSKQIIEAHNGKIWVESIKDKGSTFYFSLPHENQDKLQ